MDATPLPPPREEAAPNASALPTTVDTRVVVAGRFQLEPEFQDTPTGRLHEAVDLKAASQQAARVHIKIAPKEAFPSPMLMDRAQRELRQLAKVESSRVMKIAAFGRTPEGELYVASVPPKLGSVVLDEVVQGAGVLSPDRARKVVLQIGEALIEANQAGVVHRNIAPHTVYLAPDDSVLVVDFALTEVHDVKGRLVQGSPHYLSPEQAEGKSVDQRSSIYSLAAIYYYLLTGSPPISGATLADVMAQIGQPPQPVSFLRPGMPQDMDRLFSRALEKVASRRQMTLRQFLNEVDELGSIAAPQGAAPSAKPYRSPTRTLVLSGDGVRAVPSGAPRLGPPSGQVDLRPAVSASGWVLPEGALAEPAAPEVAGGEALPRPPSGEDSASRHPRTLIGMPAYGKAISAQAVGAAFSSGSSGGSSGGSLAGAQALSMPAESPVVVTRAVLPQVVLPPKSEAGPETPPEAEAASEEDEASATIPMPRMSEEELMATFGLDVPLRSSPAKEKDGDDLHGRPTVQTGSRAITERETIQITAGEVFRGVPPPEVSALAQAAPATTTPTLAPTMASSMAAPVAPAATVREPEPEPVAAKAPAADPPRAEGGFRETAWFKKGEIQDLLSKQDATTTSDSALQVSKEDHDRLSLGKGDSSKSKAKLGPGQTHRSVVPGKQMTEAELIREMRGRSRYVMMGLVFLLLLGLGALGYVVIQH